jgi:hypothetical protein
LLLGILRLYKALQIAEVYLPEDTILFQPSIHRPERFRVEVVDAMAPLAPFLNQVRLT